MAQLSFTKQELNTLHEFLDNACENYQEPNYVYELRDKIQYMIEHCERQERTAAKFEEWQRQLSK